LIRPKTPASVGGGFQRAVKSSMDSANIQRGLNPPLNEVSFNVFPSALRCAPGTLEPSLRLRLLLNYAVVLGIIFTFTW
ncbi:MAG: hypothetical protein AB1815_05260, partial [Bacillota bacterium]